MGFGSWLSSGKLALLLCLAVLIYKMDRLFKVLFELLENILSVVETPNISLERL